MEFLRILIQILGAAGVLLTACAPHKPIRLDKYAESCGVLTFKSNPTINGFRETNLIPSFRWKKDIKYPVSIDPVLSDGWLLVPVPENKLYIISAKNGSVRAEIKFREPILTPLAVADSFTAINVGGKKLTVENWVTGKVSWETDLDGSITPPMVFDNRLLWLDGTKFLRCFDLTEGKRIWAVKLRNTSYSVLGLNSGGAVIIDDKGLIECYDISNGRLKWNMDTGQRIRSSPAFFEGSMLFGTVDGMVARVMVNSGELVWMKDLGERIFGEVISDGMGVYLGTVDRNLIMLEYESGEILWKKEIEGPVKAGPGLLGNFAVFVSLDFHAYFVNKFSGDIELKFKTDAMLTTKPLSCGDKVYFAGEDSYLYCFELGAEGDSGY